MASATIEKLLEDRTLYEEAAVDQAVPVVREAIASILARGGKRLRPAVLLAAAGAGPLEPEPLLSKGAVAVELLHTATIVHDDIVDRGELRRGQPTPDTRYGEHAAATLGVWLLGRAVALLSECGEQAFAYAARRVRELFDGQLLEIGDLFNADRTPAACIAAARGKTASLFRLSAWLGGLLSGGSPRTLQTLERFGVEYGIAYQIADDILDLYEDRRTGKPAGKDIGNGVYTLPVLYALQADPSLRRLLAGPLDSGAGLRWALAALRRTDGVARALRVCREHAAIAAAAAERLPVGDDLLPLVDQLLARCEPHAGSG